MVTSVNAGKKSLTNPADRRKSPRLALPNGGLPVICRRGNQLLISKANQVNETGVFIFTTTPFVVGTVFDLELRLNHAEFRTQAKVRSAVPGGGMGIQFLVTSEESQLRLVKHIVHAHAARRRKRVRPLSLATSATSLSPAGVQGD